jgi:uncharacterized protein YutE (UPF0331/DUF86 family)
MINKDLILKKIKEINNFLELLEKYENLKVDDFLKNIDLIDAVKYRLINIIEACINICNHIVVKKFNIIPETYGECFKILGEYGIIDKDLSNSLVKMAHFRNLLIHLYSKVDDKEVYKILKENIIDVKNFIKEISKIL